MCHASGGTLQLPLHQFAAQQGGAAVLFQSLQLQQGAFGSVIELLALHIELCLALHPHPVFLLTEPQVFLQTAQLIAGLQRLLLQKYRFLLHLHLFLLIKYALLLPFLLFLLNLSFQFRVLQCQDECVTLQHGPLFGDDLLHDPCLKGVQHDGENGLHDSLGIHIIEEV